MTESKNPVIPSTKRDEIPPEVRKIVFPALQVGAASGTSGLLVGAFAGIIRSNTPVLFSLFSGVQCFVLGFNITAFRGLIIQSWGKEKLTHNEKIMVSSAAGGLGGGMSGAILRGRTNVIPGAIMFTLFGAIGQMLFNKFETRTIEPIPREQNNTDSWLNSKWSPVKPLSDEEYEGLMNEKLLKIKTEIALVDEKIELVKKEIETATQKQDRNHKKPG
ncbi:hypothetical protein K3495_g6450 [Podosphaera aphanis]|nr:hypothetical protein K3495_g6450 [Podosphaera aphanis]